MNKRIKGFDGLRGIASVAVIFTHTAAGFSQIGGYAVNLFFVLSGFLILSGVHSARTRIEYKTSTFKAELARFWARRIARIVPAYYFIVGLYLMFLTYFGMLTIKGSFFYLSYTQNLYMAWVGQWLHLGYTWTLAAEQQFYLIFAPLLLFIPARNHVTFLAVATSTLLLTVCFLYLVPIISPFVVARLPIIAFFLAAAGGFIAISQKAQKMVPRGAYVGVIAVIVVVISLAPSSFFSNRPVLNSAQLAFQTVAFPMLLVWIVKNQNSRVVAILETKWLVFLGAVSYSTYLVHGQISETLKENWPQMTFLPHILAAAAERLSLFLTVMSLSVGLGYLCWRYIETAFIGSRPIEIKNEITDIGAVNET